MLSIRPSRGGPTLSASREDDTFSEVFSGAGHRTLGVFEVELPGDIFLLPGDGSLTVAGNGFDDRAFNDVRPFVGAVEAPALRFDSLDPPSATLVSTNDPPPFLTGLRTSVFLRGLAGAAGKQQGLLPAPSPTPATASAQPSGSSGRGH